MKTATPQWIIGILVTSLCSFSLLAQETELRFPKKPNPHHLARQKPLGQLREGFEPSGMTWHPRLKKLVIVGDDGDTTTMNIDGSDAQNTFFRINVKTDFEAVTIADPATDFVYIGTERPNTVIEYNIVTKQYTRQFDLSSIMPNAGNEGIEAIAFVPDATDPEGGLFYVGYQKTGSIYRIRLSIMSSPTDTQATFIDKFTPMPREKDLAGLTWDADNQRLLAIWDKPNILLAMTRDGKIIKRWNKVRGSNQEGIVLIDGDLYMAEDSGDLYKYDKPLD